MQPIIHTVFEANTSAWQYIVACPSTRDAMIIDPVLDFDDASLAVSMTSAQHLLELVKSHGYRVVRLLETHAHADHLTAAFYLQQELAAKGQPRAQICIGQDIRVVQSTFGRKFNIAAADLEGVFDHLFKPGERFEVGSLEVEVLHLPGHTPDHMGYLIGENVFTG